MVETKVKKLKVILKRLPNKDIQDYKIFIGHNENEFLQLLNGNYNYKNSRSARCTLIYESTNVHIIILLNVFRALINSNVLVLQMQIINVTRL